MTKRLLAFGEILLRLSPPGRQMLLQSPNLDVWVGGAEANVVRQLACLGHDVALASRVPDNDLGRAAIANIRACGVDTQYISTGGDRLGLYFVTSGSGLRGTDVIYDRVGSAFADAPDDLWQWDRFLDEIDHLHLSGITPALGPRAARWTVSAAEAAGERGVFVSFDGNWRGKLWARWNGDAAAILRKIMGRVDLFFGSHRDIALLLGRDDFPGEGSERRRRAAEAAFEEFPKLSMIACTTRHVDQAEINRLSARIDTHLDSTETEELLLSGIVDRIGGGDAFVAGVLHALRSGEDIAVAARWGLAVSALKHSLPGDVGLFRQADIDRFLTGKFDVRR